MFRIVIATLLIGSLLSVQLFAETGDWAAVQALAVGERIQVDVSSGKMLRGSLDRVTSDSLFVKIDARVTEVSQKDVSRVFILRKSNWRKTTLIGAGIGAGAGAGIGAGSVSKEFGYGAAVAGVVAIFAAIGAGVGYAFRSNKPMLVYRAPSRPR